MLKRKGVIETTSHVILLVLIGGLLAGTLGGPMYSAIKEGFDILDRYTGVKEYQPIESRDQLGEFAHYVWDRAHNCDNVQNTLDSGGYPLLEGTDYSSQPGCAGAPGTLAADVLGNLVGDTGNDMEGRYSRIKFEVQNDMVLQSYEVYGSEEHKNSGWEDNEWFRESPYHGGPNKLGFAFKTVSTSEESFSELVSDSCMGPIGADYYGGWSTSTQYTWPIVFDTEISDERYVESGNDPKKWEDATVSGWGGSDEPYCGSDSGFLTHRENLEKWNGEEGNIWVKLCEGDKGYIQVNKGSPSNDGESTASDNTQYFPYIQITSVEKQSCGTLRPQIPSRVTSIGTVLQVNMDADKQYPTLGEFKLHDISSSKNIYTVNPMRLSVPDEDECGIAVRDNDPAVPDDGSAAVHTGVVIDQGGSTEPGTFPLKNSPQLAYHPAGGGNLDTGISGEKDDLDVYEDLSTKGLDGSDVDGVFGLLRSDSGNYEFKMHGDMLCGKNGDGSRAKWYVCDEKNFDAPYPATISWGDHEWECTPSDGNWKQVSGPETAATISYPSTVTTDYTDFEPSENEDQVISVSGDQFTLDADEDSSHNYLKYLTVPAGDKTVKFTLNFAKKGHLQIDAQDEYGETVTYVNTHQYGEDAIYSQTPDGYSNTGETYSTGQDYTFIISRSGDSNRWQIKSGGSTIWEYSGDMSDFQQIQIEAWGGDSEDVEVTFKEVWVDNSAP